MGSEKTGRLTLDTLIVEIENEISKAKVHRSPLLEKRNNILLGHLLELKEHRKFHGIDKIIERYNHD